MTTTNQMNWAVVEDNGGGLHLYVFAVGADGSSGKCVFAATHYEQRPESLLEDIQSLRDGNDTSEWETQDGMDDQESSWGEWTEEGRRNGGWKIIADETGPLPAEQMGTSGRAAFYTTAGSHQ